MLGEDEWGPEKFRRTVEVDDAYIGGAGKWRHAAQKKAHGVTPGRPSADDPFKTPVLGIAERGMDGRNGRVHARVVPNVGREAVMPRIGRKVALNTKVYTDEHGGYSTLSRYYNHATVNHDAKVYVDGDVHTNTIEGFWSLVKRGITGVYHGVGPQHLQSYLDEYTFRYNHRDAPSGMFNAFLDRIAG